VPRPHCDHEHLSCDTHRHAARGDAARLCGADGAVNAAFEFQADCVVFPEPVSPQTITTGFAAMAAWISARLLATGGSSLKLGCASRSWRCLALSLEMRIC
jgi:hypothetical protein